MTKDVILHGLKVGLFIAISGAITALIGWVGTLHPTATEAVVATGLINIVLAWAKNYFDRQQNLTPQQ